MDGPDAEKQISHVNNMTMDDFHDKKEKERRLNEW